MSRHRSTMLKNWPLFLLIARFLHFSLSENKLWIEFTIFNNLNTTRFLGYSSPEEIKIKVVKRMSLQISGFFQGFEIIKKWCDLKNFISRKKSDL